MRKVVFAFPGDLSTPTGGYAYDRRIIAELGALDWRVDLLRLGDGFPFPSAAVKATADQRLAAIAAGRTVVIDGLAFGVLDETARKIHDSHALVALVHHPLAHESGLRKHEAERLRRSEQAALTYARRVIVTSKTTARLLAEEYAVAAERISIVRPGTDRAKSGTRTVDQPTIRLLAVGSVIARKGYDVLVAALARLTALPWRLTIAGALHHSPATVQRLEAEIARLRLAERITMIGHVAPDRVADLYAAADVFVLASRFEGYGMAYAEALAHGLPVIGTTAGAVPETVPAGAGVLVPPGDVDRLATALRRVIANPAERRRLAAAARAAAAALPTWPEAGRQFAAALDRVAGESA